MNTWRALFPLELTIHAINSHIGCNATSGESGMAINWHVKWLAEGVERWNQRRKKVRFSPDLSGINFFELLPPDYRDSPKTSRYFEKIDLWNSNLKGSILAGLNFSHARFTGADLSQADLSRTNFSYADFTDAKLNETRVMGSDFSNSKVITQFLAATDLHSAKLDKAVVASDSLPEETLSLMRVSGASVFRSVLEYQSFLLRKVEVVSNPRTKREGDDRSRKNRYDVFFGTNRNTIYQRGALVGFGSELVGDTTYGICEVEIPDRRRVGTLGRPRWTKLFNRRDAKLEIKRLISLNPELFWAHIQDVAEQQPVDSRPIIFVHGFNNSFESAVVRAAQIGFDLGVGQGIGLFSWASKGQPIQYAADESATEASKYALADFIEAFVINSRDQRINIVAHSMGCRCLMLAIEVLASGRRPVLQAIDQIVLTAADVSNAVMPMQAAHALHTAKRLTSYVSDKDRALSWSGRLHGGPRAGYMPPVFVLNGMDTVAVNSDDLGTFGHTYVATSRIVLGDIFAVLRNNLPPSNRHGLVQEVDGVNKYWRIKE